MNNSFIPQQDTEQITESLVTRQMELVKSVQALAKLIETKEYQVIEELVLTPYRKGIERRLGDEATKSEVSLSRLYRIQGEKIASGKHDLRALHTQLQNELNAVSKRLQLE